MSERSYADRVLDDRCRNCRKPVRVSCTSGYCERCKKAAYAASREYRRAVLERNKKWHEAHKGELAASRAARNRRKKSGESGAGKPA